VSRASLSMSIKSTRFRIPMASRPNRMGASRGSPKMVSNTYAYESGRLLELRGVVGVLPLTVPLGSLGLGLLLVPTMLGAKSIGNKGTVFSLALYRAPLSLIVESSYKCLLSTIAQGPLDPPLSI
jgi:hypothetical protein